MKRTLLILSTLFGIITSIIAQTNTNADKILGQYWSPKKDGKIEIYKTGRKYFGKFIWGKNPRKDTENPDEKLRSRELIGLTFLYNFSFNNNYYVDGKIYDPESGKTFKCKMWLDNGNLKARGFVGLSMLGRTETFVKIQ